jgi:hemolysin III
MPAAQPQTSEPESRGRFKEPFSGFSHAAGLAASMVGSLVLALVIKRDAATIATVLVYGVTLVTLYAASSAYHLVRASERLEPWLRRFDHCAIFAFIAGTCTPVFFHAFDGTRRTFMLVLIWAIAAVGMLSRIVWLGAPRWLYLTMYLGMGWVVVIQGRALLQGLASHVTALVVAGGLVYTAGAIIYAAKRPNLFGGRLGFHDLWHLFVLGGSGCHFAAVYVLSRA